MRWLNSEADEEMAELHVHGYHGSPKVPATWVDIDNSKHWPAWINSSGDNQSKNNELKFAWKQREEFLKFTVAVNSNLILPVVIDTLGAHGILKKKVRERIKALITH